MHCCGSRGMQRRRNRYSACLPTCLCLRAGCLSARAEGRPSTPHWLAGSGTTGCSALGPVEAGCLAEHEEEGCLTFCRPSSPACSCFAGEHCLAVCAPPARALAVVPLRLAAQRQRACAEAFAAFFCLPVWLSLSALRRWLPATSPRSLPAWPTWLPVCALSVCRCLSVCLCVSHKRLSVCCLSVCLRCRCVALSRAPRSNCLDSFSERLRAKNTFTFRAITVCQSSFLELFELIIRPEVAVSGKFERAWLETSFMLT